MQPEPKKKSMRMVILMFGIRKYLEQKNESIETFLSRVNLKNPSQLNQYELQKIIQFSGCSFDTMDIYELFEELKYNQPTVKISNLKAIYNSSLKDYPSEGSKSEKKEKADDKTMEVQKKMLKLGLMKLERYVKNNDVLQLFSDCDPEETGYLDKKRFNKFLISTDIKELNDKNIRHVLIKKLFSYYQNEQMKLQDFLNLFKVKLPDKKELQKKKQEELKREQEKRKKMLENESSPVVDDKNYLNPNNVGRNNMMEKKNVDENYYAKPEMKFTNSEAVDDQFIDAASIFPRSYSLYRLGIPPPEQLRYLQQLQGYLQSSQQFKDPDNPKTATGTYSKASQFFKGRYEIFVMAASVINREKSRIGLAREIQPKDIIQGQVGDCYLLSSIASVISYYPEVISDKILFQVSPAKFYAVKLFIDGQWVIQTTDDSFPCKYGKPIYAKPHGNQIWVLLIEKCWAKIYGSYQSIDSGTPTQGFRALTGAPSEYVLAETEQDHQSLYYQLQDAFKQKHVVTISGSKILNQMSEKEQQKIGLISGHAYSFLKFLKIGNETIVKMRNPWGKKIWKGEWSFQSSKWTKALRDKYNYNFQPDDGSFYIPWTMFIRYFSSFVFCRLDPTYVHSSMKIKPKAHKSEYLKMIINEQGNYDIAVYQQSKRKHLKNPNYDYSGSRIIIMKKQGDQMKYVGSCNHKGQVTHKQQHFTPGVYILAVKMNWDANQTEKSVCVTSYGPNKVSFQKISRSIAPSFKKMLIESYSQKVKGKIKTYEKIKVPEAESEISFSIDTGIGYMKVTNKSNKWFATTVSMKKMSGLKVIKPDKVPYRFDMHPQTSVVIGFFVSEKGYSYQSSQSMQAKG